MGDFKRNSSRFSRGGSSSEGSRSSNDSRGSYPNQSRGSGNGKSFPFTRIASVSVPKSASDDARDFVNKELRDSGLKVTAKVYLGKGDNELNLKNGDLLLIDFATTEKDPEFVVGHISVKN